MAPRSSKPARRIEAGGRSLFIHSQPRHSLHDLYHYCMTISWPQFYLFIAMSFIALNLLFAGLYQLQPGGIANQFPQGFLGAFFSASKRWPLSDTATCIRRRCIPIGSRCWKSSSA